MSQYRVNWPDSPDVTHLTPTFLGIKKPNRSEVIRAMQGTGLISNGRQVDRVILHDSLPNYWPDRITVKYNVDSGPTQILLIRMRKDRN